jgi:hypothetical protein
MKYYIIYCYSPLLEDFDILSLPMPYRQARKVMKKYETTTLYTKLTLKRWNYDPNQILFFDPYK